MRNVPGILLFITTVMAGCTTTQPANVPEPDKSYKPIANVPHEQAVGIYHLKLKASLSRNFMPVVPNGGAPLIAVISLNESSQKSIAGKFELQSFKIAASEGIWTPGFITENTSARDYEITRVSHDGPHLDPGRFVDIVGEFKSLETGQTYQILASKQVVGRSE
jgi:hypothetical protein